MSSTAEISPIFDVGSTEPEIALFFGKSHWFLALAVEKAERYSLGGRFWGYPPRTGSQGFICNQSA